VVPVNPAREASIEANTVLTMTTGAGASASELLTIGVVALPVILAPLAILYWVFKAGRRSGVSAAKSGQPLD
jgi:hypothetical protein